MADPCREKENWAAPVAAERLTVYTVNYPLKYFAERIAGVEAEIV